MRMIALRTALLKGAQADLGWAPLTVLFGANNSGKSNLLEATGQALGLEPPRTDPLIDWDSAEDEQDESRAIIELDEVNAGDRAFLCEALQYGAPEWTVVLQVPRFAQAKRRTQLWDDSEDATESWGPLGLDKLRTIISDYHVEVFRLGYVGEWDAVAEDVRLIAERLATVRHLVAQPYLSWLAISLSDPLVRGAGARLWHVRERWPDQVPFASLLRRCAEGTPDFLGVWELEADTLDESWPLWDVTVFSTDTEPDSVAAVVEEELGEALGRRQWRQPAAAGFTVQAPGVPGPAPGFTFGPPISPEEFGNAIRPRLRGDVWLAEGEDGVVLRPLLIELAAEVSAEATRLAPPFIRDSLDVVVTALSPAQWRPNDDRRVRLAVRDRNTGRHFDLRVTGSGVAVWTAIAIREAMDRLRRPAPSEPSPVPPPETGEEDEYFIAQVEKMRVYLIDEPERHLHPIAQREAAAWIANLVEQPGAPSVIVATHSPAFLDLPSQLAQYIGVTRDEGFTTARPITTDEITQIDGFAQRLGVSRADLIQLVRMVLIVEGKHDRAAVEHFFAGELEAARATVLPIRGTGNRSGIPESETLAALGVPVVILFDDVHAEFLNGDRPAETGEEKQLKSLRELWQERRGDATLRLVAFNLPDIFAALPDESLAEAVKARGGAMPADGIAGALERYRAAGATNFKSFLAGECRVGTAARDVDRLLDLSLTHAVGRPPHLALRNAVLQALGGPGDVGHGGR